jgi:hypothetical protein
MDKDGIRLGATVQGTYDSQPDRSFPFSNAMKGHVAVALRRDTQPNNASTGATNADVHELGVKTGNLAPDVVRSTSTAQRALVLLLGRHHHHHSTVKIHHLPLSLGARRG